MNSYILPQDRSKSILNSGPGQPQAILLFCHLYFWSVISLFLNELVSHTHFYECNYYVLLSLSHSLLLVNIVLEILVRATRLEKEINWEKSKTHYLHVRVHKENPKDFHYYKQYIECQVIKSIYKNLVFLYASNNLKELARDTRTEDIFAFCTWKHCSKQWQER